MNSSALFQRYLTLQTYVGWTEEDSARIVRLGDLLGPALVGLVEDFYTTIRQHPGAFKALSGGEPQIKRLQGTLLRWLQELLTGVYDQDYVHRRWRVGARHVEIGLDQVYTNVALSRLRRGLLHELNLRWTGPANELAPTMRSLNTLLDLDLAIIEDAYQAEYLARHQRVERLAAIGQVAGGVAHELRNPLNVIKTSVYYLLHAQTLVPEKRKEHLERIERHVVLADGVITALSNFARMPVPERTPFSLPLSLQECLETNSVPDHVRVSFECSDALPQALADPGQIKIVFGNLIRNACEAMTNGGRLSIAVRQLEEGQLAVDVTDTGVGIPPERMHHLMEPLYSTKARGLGLGLAIARAILDKNQGALRVVSEPGKGSTFTVLLQAAG
ncbi:MAG: protoglobin domain-containing protein [Gemmataceae bacterium]